jgi:hypothetical protein
LPLTSVHNVVTHTGGGVGVGPTVTLGFPSRSGTNSGPVSYTVTYSDSGSGLGPVTLSTTDITLNKTGTADATVAVTPGPTSTVTLTSVTGDGTLGISLAAGTATDGAGNSAPAAGPSTTFTVDNTGPPVAIGAPSAASTTGASVSYTVTYTGANSVVLTPALVTLNSLGSATGTVSVTGSGVSTRTVTISDITGIGELSISLLADTAFDAIGSGSPAAGPSAMFHVVNDAPVVQSAVVQPGGQTMNVTFSKPMAVAGIATPENYIISGPGIGNLTIAPDSVILVSGST